MCPVEQFAGIGLLFGIFLVANDMFQVNFTVPKVQWRADPYDNQVGEMESADTGFSYEQYERSKEVLLCEEIEA